MNGMLSTKRTHPHDAGTPGVESLAWLNQTGVSSLLFGLSLGCAFTPHSPSLVSLAQLCTVALIPPCRGSAGQGPEGCS